MDFFECHCHCHCVHWPRLPFAPSRLPVACSFDSPPRPFFCLLVFVPSCLRLRVCLFQGAHWCAAEEGSSSTCCFGRGPTPNGERRSFVPFFCAGGVLTIPPPILTRVFQELDAAMSKYHQAEKFSKVPFPFPYVAALELFMVIHTLLTPLTLVNIIPNLVWPPLLTFVFVFMLWSLHFACSELENPYMGDANDLDLQDMQCILNDRLASITITRNQVVPRLVNLEGAIAWLRRTRTEKSEEAKMAHRKRRMSVSKMEDVNDTLSLESPHTSEEIVEDSTIGTEVSMGSGSNLPSNSNRPSSSTTILRSEVGHSRETGTFAAICAQQSSQDSPVAAHDVHIGCPTTIVSPSRTSHTTAEIHRPVLPVRRRRSMRRSMDENTVGSFFRNSLHGRESILSQAMASSADEASYMNDCV